MAPEQTRADAVGPASDQYSLGCVLYELLTGRTPFSGPVEIQLLLHQTQEPTRPRSVNPAVPHDLETIALKCLEKDPSRRYADCQEVADDLRRWQEGEPIAARRIGAGERLVRWVRKNPVVAGSLAFGMVALLIGLTASLVQVNIAKHEATNAKAAAEDAATKKLLADEKSEEAKREADLARIAEKEAEKQTEIAKKQAEIAQEKTAQIETEKAATDKQLTRAEKLVYANNIANAQRAWDENRVGLAHNYLDDCRWDYRGWEHNYVFSLLHRNQATLKGHTREVTSAAWSPDGKRIVSAELGQHGEGVGRGQRDRRVLSLKGHTDSVSAAWRSAPTANASSSASEDKTVKVWDADNGTGEPHPQGAHKSVSTAWRSAPMANASSRGSGDKTVKVWDADNGPGDPHPQGAHRVRSAAWRSAPTANASSQRQ